MKTATVEFRADSGEGGEGESVAKLTAAMSEADEPAFRRFHARYWPRIYAYLLVATHGDEVSTEELTQKTMIRVAGHIRPFPSEGELWAWLRTIARNIFRDALRSSRRQPPFVEWSEAMVFTAASADGVDGRLVGLLKECLAELDPLDRSLVERVYIEKEKRTDVAHEWKLSVKALESRLARLRMKLRRLALRKLKDEGR